LRTAGSQNPSSASFPEKKSARFSYPDRPLLI
jgi:hypothetical protein